MSRLITAILPVQMPLELKLRVKEIAEQEILTTDQAACLLLREGIRARYGVNVQADGTVQAPTEGTEWNATT